MLLICLFLVSCSRNHNEDVYFIHAVGFEGEQNDISIHALIEKQSGDGKQEEKGADYFVATVKGQNIKQATKKLSSKYKDCYYATSEFYVISESASPLLLEHMARELSESNVFPSKSKIICAKERGVSEFLEAVKNEEDLKKLKKLSDKQKTNIIKFLTQFTSGHSASLPSLSIDSEGKLSSREPAYFKLSQESTKVR